MPATLPRSLAVNAHPDAYANPNWWLRLRKRFDHTRFGRWWRRTAERRERLVLVFGISAAAGLVLMMVGLFLFPPTKRLYSVAGCQADLPLLSSCLDAAEMFEKGEGGPKNLAVAELLYERACLVKVIRDVSHRVKGTLLSAKGDACLNAGRLSEYPQSPVRNLRRAADLYIRGCDLGANDYSYAAACYRAGVLLRNTGTNSQVASYFARACEGQNAEGCFELGDLYSRGQGVSADTARAAGLYQQACSLGNKPACQALGGQQ